MSRQIRPQIRHYIIIAEYDAEVVSVGTCSEGDERSLMDPEIWGLDAGTAISLQQLTPAQVAECAPLEWDAVRAYLQALI